MNRGDVAISICSINAVDCIILAIGHDAFKDRTLDELKRITNAGDYDPHPADRIKHPLARAIRDFPFVLLEKCGHYLWRERNVRDTFYYILNVEI